MKFPILSTWLIDIIDIFNNNITTNIHEHQNLLEIRKLLWITIRLYNSYAMKFGDEQQQNTSIFWINAENILLTNNIQELESVINTDEKERILNYLNY